MPSAKKAKIRSAHSRLDIIHITLVIILMVLVVIPMSIVPNSNLSSAKCNSNKKTKTTVLRCSIELEYADTHSEQVLGLSGRDALEKDSGMLFIYDYPDTRCMWMKDMRFSLDMIWLDKDQKVLKIARSISPDTFPQTFCAGNAKYVIELNTGMADKLRYKVGDYIKL